MAAKKKPSAAQLAARAKFVAMVRAKSKAKKSATKKTTVKKAAPKKAAKKKVVKKMATHKDTKSHNVRINVVSGIDNIDRLRQAVNYKVRHENSLKAYKSILPKNRNSHDKIMLKSLPQLIAGDKKIISELKKHIK